MSAAEAPAAPWDPAYLKTCCADLWAHPGVRLLAGDALHPGGRALTERALDLLRPPRGGRLLDVGSGPGTALAAISDRGLDPVGIDLSRGWRGQVREAPFAAADAERLPFRGGSFDGALLECVLSVIPDKARTVAELARVIRPGGGVAVADVTLAGTLPGDLGSLVGWIACAAGALPRSGYIDLLTNNDFVVTHQEDHAGALAEMVAKARRRLAMLQGAVATGLVDAAGAGLPEGLLELGQRVLGQASDVVADRVLGYSLIVARR